MDVALRPCTTVAFIHSLAEMRGVQTSTLYTVHTYCIQAAKENENEKRIEKDRTVRGTTPGLPYRQLDL